jgi:hypothetical protein
MKWSVLKFAVVVLAFSSCIVQSPKYTSLKQVTLLQLGMTKTEVEERLDLQPYDLKAYTDTSKVFIYVYRVIDRKTLSFNTGPTNGREVRGRYVQMFITYSKDDKVINIESCPQCPDNLMKETRIDLEKIFLFATVTLPVILIYVGLKQAN